MPIANTMSQAGPLTSAWRAAMRSAASWRLVLAAFVALAVPAGDSLAQQPAGEPVEDAAAADGGPAAADQNVEALIRILEDDAARARLIERLRAAGDVTEAAPIEATAVDQTLADRLAAYTREAAESAANLAAAMSGLVNQFAEITNGALAIDFAALERVVLDVALLVLATFTVYIILQLMFRALQRRTSTAAAAGDLVKRIKMTGASIVLDIVTVVAAWGIGYVIALYIGAGRQIGVNQSLFLNAFLIIELIKAGARGVLSPRWTSLRPFKLDDTTAAYWYFWLSRLVSLIGYTFLFVTPILAAGVSADVADGVRIVVMFTALVIAVAIVLQNRDSVRARLTHRADDGRSDPLSRTLSFVGRIWHVAAITYLVGVFLLWLTRPETALPFVLSATWKSVVAVLLGTIIASFISRIASGGMRLPEDVRARLPLLEQRLNAFVPGVLRVVRAIVTLAVIVTIIDVWGIANIAGWLASADGQVMLARVISAGLILLIGSVVYLVVQSWVEYRLNPNLGRYVSARERTLLGLFRNAFTVVLGVMVFMLVLDQLGVSIAPLLAGAGVVGLAIGFGAQKLVQDIINGAFIQFENTMNEGDVVTLGGVSGVVERLTIRSVSLRSLDGTYHVIPFSSVDTVANAMKHFSYHLAEISVAYRERIPEVKAAMLEAFARLKQTELSADILGDFEMQGVTQFATSAVVVRGRIKTLPGKQWGVGRAYNEIVKLVFDERGIEIPYPHVKLYLGQDESGRAARLRIQSVPPPEQDAGARASSGHDTPSPDGDEHDTSAGAPNEPEAATRSAAESGPRRAEAPHGATAKRRSAPVPPDATQDLELEDSSADSKD